jgi:hypothetical protein
VARLSLTRSRLGRPKPQTGGGGSPTLIGKTASDTAGVFLQEASAGVFSSIAFLTKSDDLFIRYQEGGALVELPGGNFAVTTFDVMSPTITEVVGTIISVSSRSDTMAVLVTEAKTILSSLSRTDNVLPKITESINASAKSLTRTDSMAIAYEEARALQRQSTSTDTVAVLVTEATAILSRLSRTDTASPMVTEAKAIQAGLLRTDSLLPMVTEVSDKATDGVPDAISDLTASGVNSEQADLDFTPASGATTHEWRWSPHGLGSWSTPATLPDNTGNNTVSI